MLPPVPFKLMARSKGNAYSSMLCGRTLSHLFVLVICFGFGAVVLVVFNSECRFEA